MDKEYFEKFKEEFGITHSNKLNVSSIKIGENDIKFEIKEISFVYTHMYLIFIPEITRAIIKLLNCSENSI